MFCARALKQEAGRSTECEQGRLSCTTWTAHIGGDSHGLDFSVSLHPRDFSSDRESHGQALATQAMVPNDRLLSWQSWVAAPCLSKGVCPTLICFALGLGLAGVLARYLTLGKQGLCFLGEFTLVTELPAAAPFFFSISCVCVCVCVETAGRKPVKNALLYYIAPWLQ